MGNPYLNLSLFIMLLSFFLILNGISNFQNDKSFPVLNSLNITFTKKELEAPKPSQSMEDEESSRKGNTLDKLEALFKVHIANAESAKRQIVLYSRSERSR